jgi:hypothetical protein
MLDEIDGVARGADVPVEAVLAANFALARAGAGVDVVAAGDATTLGETVHASTLEGLPFAAALRPLVAVRAHEPRDGHAFASVSFAGVVAPTCVLGAQGLSVAVEGDAGREPTDAPEAMPAGFAVRDAIERADDLEAAVAILSRAPVRAGTRFVVADGHRLDARVVEIRAKGEPAVVRKPTAAMLAGGDPAADARLSALLDAVAKTQGRFDAPVCASCLLAAPGTVTDATIAAAVFEPQVGRLQVSRSPSNAATWETYDLAHVLSPAALARDALPPKVTGAGDVVVGEARRVGTATRATVEFDSPRPSGFAFDDRIHAVLFRPAEGEAVGAVVQLPTWRERTLVGEELIAMNLAMRGVAVLLFPLPYQVDRAAPGVRSGEWTLSTNLSRSREAWVQGMADVARASYVLEGLGFPPSKQGIAGISLGGHVGADAFGAYPDRFVAGAFVLAGGDVSKILSADSQIVGAMRERLERRGATEQRIVDLVRPMDPAFWANPARRDAVFLVGAKRDEIVPPDQVEALAKAYGGVEVFWIDATHTSGLSEAPRILDGLSKHFRTRFGAS